MAHVVVIHAMKFGHDLQTPLVHLLWLDSKDDHANNPQVSFYMKYYYVLGYIGVYGFMGLDFEVFGLGIPFWMLVY